MKLKMGSGFFTNVLLPAVTVVSRVQISPLPFFIFFCLWRRFCFFFKFFQFNTFICGPVAQPGRALDFSTSRLKEVELLMLFKVGATKSSGVQIPPGSLSHHVWLVRVPAALGLAPQFAEHIFFIFATPFLKGCSNPSGLAFYFFSLMVLVD